MKKHTLNTFHPTTYGQLIAYLEKQASEGWLLEKIGFATLTFTAITPQTVRFFGDMEPAGGYQDIVVESTAEQQTRWHFIDRMGKMALYYSLDPKQVPLKTDHDLANQLFQPNAFEHTLWSSILALVICVVPLAILFGPIFWLTSIIPSPSNSLLTTIFYIMTLSSLHAVVLIGFVYPLILFLLVSLGLWALRYTQANQLCQMAQPFEHRFIKLTHQCQCMAVYGGFIIIILILIALIADWFLAPDFRMESLSFFMQIILFPFALAFLSTAIQKRSGNKIIGFFLVFMFSMAFFFFAGTIVVTWDTQVITAQAPALEDRAQNGMVQDYPVLTLADCYPTPSEPKRAMFSQNRSLLRDHYRYFENSTTLPPNLTIKAIKSEGYYAMVGYDNINKTESIEINVYSYRSPQQALLAFQHFNHYYAGFNDVEDVSNQWARGQGVLIKEQRLLLQNGSQILMIEGEFDHMQPQWLSLIKQRFQAQAQNI